jgi:hypothetical protein
MQIPPELNEYWKDHVRMNPGRSYNNAEIWNINRKFTAYKNEEEKRARKKRRDLELYQRKWEELSGTYTEAPEYMPAHASAHGAKFQFSNDMGSGRTYAFLKSRADELNKHQRRMARKQQQPQQPQQQPYWDGKLANSPGQNNASPSMQNPFNFNF